MTRRARPVVYDHARCPQCRQVLLPSEWSEDVGIPVLECRTLSCPTGGAGNPSILVLFTVEEHEEDWSDGHHATDVIVEEPMPHAVVDEDGGIELVADARAESAAFRLAFPELCKFRISRAAAQVEDTDEPKGSV